MHERLTGTAYKVTHAGLQLAYPRLPRPKTFACMCKASRLQSWREMEWRRARASTHRAGRHGGARPSGGRAAASGTQGWIPLRRRERSISCCCSRVEEGIRWLGCMCGSSIMPGVAWILPAGGEGRQRSPGEYHGAGRRAWLGPVYAEILPVFGRFR